MITIFDLAQDYGGILSLGTLALLITCLVLMSSIHPLILGATRLGDMTRWLTRSFGQGYQRQARGLDTSSFNTVGTHLVTGNVAAIPGYILFFAGLFTHFTGTPHHIFDPDSFSQDRLVYAAGLCIVLSAIQPVLEGMRYFWGTQRGHAFIRLILACSGLVFLAGTILSGFSAGWILTTLLLMITAYIVMRIATIGTMAFDAGAVLWIPMVLLGWLVAVAVTSLIGPAVKIFYGLIDGPGLGALVFGQDRQAELSEKNSISPPVNVSQDSIHGMLQPR